MSATDGTQIKHRFHPSQQQQPTSSPRRRVGRYNPRVVLGVNAQNAILHMFDVLGRVTAESNVRSSEQGISVFRTKDPSRVCCLYQNGASFRESAWTTPPRGCQPSVWSPSTRWRFLSARFFTDTLGMCGSLNDKVRGSLTDHGFSIISVHEVESSHR